VVESLQRSEIPQFTTNSSLFTPNKATMVDNGIWTAEELMHGKDGVASPTKEAPASPTHGSKLSLRKLKSKSKSTDPMDWGMPGHLTEDEVAVFVSCRLCVCIL
jgi:hypothetical protein